MAEGFVPSVKFIAKTLSESPEEKHKQNKSKFTEENVRNAIKALNYDDLAGNYKYSEIAMLYDGHLGKIADQIIKSVTESKSSSPESKSSSPESKTKRKRRRRGKGSVKGGSRRNRK